MGWKIDSQCPLVGWFPEGWQGWRCEHAQEALRGGRRWFLLAWPHQWPSRCDRAAAKDLCAQGSGLLQLCSSAGALVPCWASLVVASSSSASSSSRSSSSFMGMARCCWKWALKFHPGWLWAVGCCPAWKHCFWWGVNKGWSWAGDHEWDFMGVMGKSPYREDGLPTHIISSICQQIGFPKARIVFLPGPFLPRWETFSIPQTGSVQPLTVQHVSSLEVLWIWMQTLRMGWRRVLCFHTHENTVCKQGIASGRPHCTVNFTTSRDENVIMSHPRCFVLVSMDEGIYNPGNLASSGLCRALKPCHLWVTFRFHLNHRWSGVTPIRTALPWIYTRLRQISLKISDWRRRNFNINDVTTEKYLDWSAGVEC